MALLDRREWGRQLDTREQDMEEERQKSRATWLHVGE